jgi:glycosyltransferase involved in cell wall biosynthesis
VCIVCRNEADRLGPCLESVAWADELVVVDLESDDGSGEVARAHGATVIRRGRVPVVEAVRNEAAAAATGEWVLALDPDERVSPGLAAALQEARARTDVDMVVIPFLNYDLGFPATHPMHRYDPKPRFYRRSAVSWPTVPNALPEVDESRVLRLPATDELVMVHERNRTVSEAIERALRYAPAQAQAMVDAGEVFTARRMAAELTRKAHKQFVVGEPWRDGVPGVLRASILVAFHFYVWAAFWQLSGVGRTEDDDRFVRRMGSAVETARAAARLARVPYRLVRRARGSGA